VVGFFCVLLTWPFELMRKLCLQYIQLSILCRFGWFFIFFFVCVPLTMVAPKALINQKKLLFAHRQQTSRHPLCCVCLCEMCV